MQREPRALLWDICQAADAAAEFTRGKTVQDYQQDQFLRSAVERQLTILGEALAQLAKLEPKLAQRIPEYSAIISFRNVLVHGYAIVDDKLVWSTLREDVPALGARVAQLLQEEDGSSRT